MYILRSEEIHRHAVQNQLGISVDIVSIVDGGIVHNNYYKEWNGRMKIVKNLSRLTNQIKWQCLVT